MVYADGADSAQAAEIFEAISATVSRHDLSLKERLLAFGDILEKNVSAQQSRALGWRPNRQLDCLRLPELYGSHSSTTSKPPSLRVNTHAAPTPQL
jgi:hypothetical protein